MKQALVLAALVVAPAARAEDADPNREAAQRHYARGLELASQNLYEQAIEEFGAAYRRRPHFAVLFNIAQAHIALERPVDAIAALERYLFEGADQIPADRVDAARAQIAALNAQSAEVSVVTNVPGAAVRIDGKLVGTAPLAAPVRVTAGHHTVSVSAENRPEVSRSVTLGRGDSLGLTLELADAGQALSGFLAVSCHRPVQVWVDGTRRDTSPNQPGIALDVGIHRVVLILDGQRSPERPIEIQPRATATFDCAELAPPKTDIHARANASLSSDASARSGNVFATVGYALGGAGLVLGGAALGHFVWNRERYERWNTADGELAANPSTPDYRERQLANNELAASIERASRVTVGLSVAGVAFLASGVTLVVWPRAEEPMVRAEVTESGATFALASCW